MPAVGRIKVPWKTGRFTMGTDIDRITDCAMKASTNDIKETTRKVSILQRKKRFMIKVDILRAFYTNVFKC